MTMRVTVSHPGALVKTLLSLGYVLLIAIDFQSELFEETLPLSAIIRSTVSPVTTERQTEVGNFQMTGGTDEKIVRFDIAMDPLHPMSFFNAQYHLGAIPLCHSFLEHILSE
jgi:hypothetical protein